MATTKRGLTFNLALPPKTPAKKSGVTANGNGPPSKRSVTTLKNKLEAGIHDHDNNEKPGRSVTYPVSVGLKSVQ